MEVISTPKNIIAPNAISVSVTWVDGKIIFKHNKKYSKFFYGLCAYSRGVFTITPSDYQNPLMITTISVSPIEKYCDRASSCLNFKCKLNQFNKNAFIAEFKDCGTFSLSLPNNIGAKPLWFSEGEYERFWGNFIIPIEGGILRFKEK